MFFGAYIANLYLILDCLRYCSGARLSAQFAWVLGLSIGCETSVRLAGDGCPPLLGAFAVRQDAMAAVVLVAESSTVTGRIRVISPVAN